MLWNEGLNPNSLLAAEILFITISFLIRTIIFGFAEARILEMSAQCRPSFKNNLPKIIQSNSKIIHVNGLYRHGFLIAPAIVDSVMKLLEQKDDSLIKQFEIDFQEAKYEHIC
jgi:glycine oxidase